MSNNDDDIKRHASLLIKVGGLYRAIQGIPLAYHSWYKDFNFIYHTNVEERREYGYMPRGTLFMIISLDRKHNYYNHVHWDRYKFLYLREDGKVVDAAASLTTSWAHLWFEGWNYEQ